MENLPEFYENYRKKTPGIINNSKKHPIFVFNLLFADLRFNLLFADLREIQESHLLGH